MRPTLSIALLSLLAACDAEETSPFDADGVVEPDAYGPEGEEEAPDTASRDEVACAYADVEVPLMPTTPTESPLRAHPWAA